MTSRPRCGFSLLELIVAVAILGFVVGLAGATMPFVRQHPVPDPTMMASDEAARTARIVTRDVVSGSLQVRLAAYPDGRIIADTSLAQATTR